MNSDADPSQHPHQPQPVHDSTTRRQSTRPWVRALGSTPAPVTRRAAALIIDLVIVATATALVENMWRYMMGWQAPANIALVIFAMLGLYKAAGEGLFGVSVGKKITGIDVDFGAQSSGTLNLVKAGVRNAWWGSAFALEPITDWAAPIFSLIFWLSLLAVVLDKDRLSPMDLITRTLVVRSDYPVEDGDHDQ